jgi:hypothetical protein
VQGNGDGANPQRRKAWLWVLGTTWVTVFQIQLSRGQTAAKALLGKFAGEMTAEATFSPAGLRWVSLDGALTAPELRVNDQVLEKVEQRRFNDRNVFQPVPAPAQIESSSDMEGT